MPGSSTKRNVATLIAPMPASTSVEWAAATKAVPANLMVRDTTLGRCKIGDGVTLFKDLPWAMEASIPAEFKALIAKSFETTDGGLTYSLKAAENIASGLVLAGTDGKIRHDQLPAFILNTVKVVGTYGDLQALGAEFHESLILVVDPANGTVTGGGDPTPGDTSVASGAATYIWFDPDGTGALPESWNKTSELGTIDVNWDLQLADHFKYKGTDANTLDDIQDGTIYGKVTKTEIARLAGVETLADVTDYDNVQAANAIMYDHQIVATQLTAATLDALLSLPTA